MNTNATNTITVPPTSLSPPLPPPSSSSSVTIEPVTLPPPPMSDTTTTTTTTTSVSLSSAPESLNLRPPSKLPSRPRKLRKLSPDNPNSNSNSNPNSNSNSSSNSNSNSNSSIIVTTKITPRPRLISSAPPPRSLSSEGEIEAALAHLRAADPTLAKLIDIHQPPAFDRFETPFLALTKSILYQQLAYKAGTSIYSRFVAVCGGESAIVPETILSLTPQQLRQIGVSGRKTSYLHDLARKYQNGILSDSAIINMDDKSLFTMLTMVNGIGSWSVQMFMIFSLHRPDVLPVNDLGVRKGVQLLYGLEDLPRPSQMDQLCEKWRPYRSVACWFIWRFVEAHNNPSNPALMSAPAAPNAMSSQQQQVQSLSSSHQQPQHQQQFIDPMNSIIDLGQLS